jgi:hypothetical protein
MACFRARQTDRVTSAASAAGRDRVLVRIKRIGELSCEAQLERFQIPAGQQQAAMDSLGSGRVIVQNDNGETAHPCPPARRVGASFPLLKKSLP